ncbi:MAG: hypothetical protein KBD14_00240 [Candidatus Pacebacteria bacterium]|nr:hypothetical protein [Candidatus Paceibacterota bacterium]
MDEFDKDDDTTGSDFYGGAHDDFDPLLDDDLLGDDMEGMHIADEDDDYDPEDRFH